MGGSSQGTLRETAELVQAGALLDPRRICDAPGSAERSGAAGVVPNALAVLCAEASRGRGDARKHSPGERRSLSLDALAVACGQRRERRLAGRSLDAWGGRSLFRPEQALASGTMMNATAGRFADDAAVMRRAIELAARGIGH